MDSFVEDHLHWRFLTSHDLDDLAMLRHQIQSFDDTMIPAVERLVGLQDAELDGHCVGGWDNYGSLLAYGWNIVDPDPELARVIIAGGVHPTHRYLSIGARLLAWQQDRALEWRDAERPGQPLWLGCYVEAVQPGLQLLLEDMGFRDERHFIDMHRTLDTVPTPRVINGVDIVAFDPSRSEEVHQLHHLCFGADVHHDHWDRSLHRVRSDWSWVALSGGQVVGYVLSGEDDAAALDGVIEGWTERLGVHPAHRQRGIGSALLEHTLASMAASQCPGAGIGVDTSETSFPEILHRELGYEHRDSVQLMSKTLPAAGTSASSESVS